MEEETSPFIRFMHKLYYMFDTPVVFFRKNIVEANQKKYPWYHQQFRRVPTIDMCRQLDTACILEAHYQFKRERLVDNEILHILRERYEECVFNNINDKHLCQHMKKAYDGAVANYRSRYGDLGVKFNVRTAFMKQKHRMIWERRHGPIGSGRKETYAI
ncbi:PREDICTED: NADH dehydrogenase [ubiquinone] 1 beta subcomplex subunit 10 [Dufourea novaeangliae]|uniref:NADH dehydrogenase [ubiquinone] 1 beta subcomplex subunit 10 n=1 Tax=Dufourea novaeangliae TaxID=178035 RepID=A0A154PIY1_DUFNO|nr:PREDICTED: NADH dehydrogenase [ubiquinone] 1 beta subcomplex subunit 10 [Dufourea novaeangliae]KZC11841.1 NADH dehydrogenase [ubiquinone] 1 beta subcomplex subunit 10 [Dufourea novaeangliae]